MWGNGVVAFKMAGYMDGVGNIFQKCGNATYGFHGAKYSQKS